MSGFSFQSNKIYLAAKSDVSTALACFNLFLVVCFDKSRNTLILSLIWVSDSGQ